VKAGDTKVAAYRLLTAARAATAEALPLAEAWFHKGTERSASAHIKDALKALDAAIARAAEE